MGTGVLAYFDCFSGISGPMALGALIDLDIPLPWIQEAIRRISLDGVELKVEPVVRNGIRALQVDATVEKKAPLRGYADARGVVAGAGLPQAVRENSLAVLDRIAAAQDDVYGHATGAPGLHGAVDLQTITDVVGVMLCVDRLGIEAVTASPLPLGRGIADGRGTVMPLPLPATVALLKQVPVYGVDLPAELVSLTGAAILTTLAGAFGPLPAMRIERCGFGTGAESEGREPNLLRVFIGRPDPADPGCQHDAVVVVEAGIDDMNPELFGYLMERLFEDGALDVCWIPVFMKKNRPGTLVQVLCPQEVRDRVIRRLLSETTSLGVRFHSTQRRMLKRQAVTVQTRFGELAAKQVIDIDGQVRLVPEYEACRKVAIERKIPLRQVYEEVIRKGNDGL